MKKISCLLTSLITALSILFIAPIAAEGSSRIYIETCTASSGSTLNSAEIFYGGGSLNISGSNFYTNQAGNTEVPFYYVNVVNAYIRFQPLAGKLAQGNYNVYILNAAHSSATNNGNVSVAAVHMPKGGVSLTTTNSSLLAPYSANNDPRLSDVLAFEDMHFSGTGDEYIELTLLTSGKGLYVASVIFERVDIPAVTVDSVSVTNGSANLISVGLVPGVATVKAEISNTTSANENVTLIAALYEKATRDLVWAVPSGKEITTSPLDDNEITLYTSAIPNDAENYYLCVYVWGDFSALRPIDASYKAIKIGTPMLYAFNNKKSGTAGGTVSFQPYVSGQVGLFWGAGDVKLAGYSELSSLEVTAGEAYSYSVQEFTVIPQGAEQLLLYNAGVVIDKYDIPAHKIFDYGEKKFTFGAISDLHYSDYYSTTLVPAALNKFGEEQVDLIVTAGDTTNSDQLSQLQDYSAAVNAFNAVYSNIPVYTVSGNHDVALVKTPNWSYTGDSANYAGSYSRNYIGGNGIDFTVSVGSDDIFVFLNQTYVADDVLDAGQVAWLENVVAANAGKTVYLFFHQFIWHTAGDVDNGIYRYASAVPQTSALGTKLLQLSAGNKNMIMFSGHSHWMFKLQSLLNSGTGAYNTYANIYDGGGVYGKMVHIPSVTYPRDLTPGAVTYDSKIGGTHSEGYFADVYGDCVVLKGYDFKNNVYLPYANYIIEKNN